VPVFSLIAVVYLPLLLTLIIPLFRDGRIWPIEWLHRPSFRTLIEVFNFFGAKTYNNLYGPIVNSIIDIYGLVLFLLCLIGISVTFKGDREKDASHTYANGILLSLWLIVPIFLPFIFSYLFASQGLLGPVRFVLYASPAYYLLVAKGALSLKKMARLGSIAAIVVYGIVFAKDCIYVDKNTPWPKIYAYIEQNIETDEETVFSFHGNLRNLGVIFHYLGPSFTGVWSSKLLKKTPEYKKVLIPMVNTPEEQKQVKNDLLKSIKITELDRLDYDGLWFISYDTVLDLEMINLFKKRYHLVGKKIFYNVMLYHFKK